MAKQPKNARRGWNLTLAVHVFLYLIAWIFALYSLSVLPTVNFNADHTHFIAAVMLWLPILALHVIAHVASARQSGSVENERQAYRDGFADAVRQLADRRDVVARLALNDDGERVELVEKPKRDYSQHLTD